MSVITRENAEKDPAYAPYCLGCSTMERMQHVARFLWRCRHCGTVGDDRTEAEKTPTASHQEK